MGRALRSGCVALSPSETRGEWHDRVRQIDDWGFDTLLVPDHIGLWPPFAPLISAAAASDRLRFGPQVLNSEFWNPLLLAREAATVDVLLDGRLELGFGAGHTEEEFRAAGVEYPSPAKRVAHMDELVATVRVMLDGEPVIAEGLDFVDDGVTRLAPAQHHVPFMVGGNGNQVLRVAAQQADIVSLVGFTSGIDSFSRDLSHFTWDGLADRVAWVRSQAGDRFDDLELSVLLQSVEITASRVAAAEEMAERIERPVEMVLDSPFVMTGTADDIADQVRRLRDECGVTYLTTFEPFAEDLAKVMNQVR